MTDAIENDRDAWIPTTAREWYEWLIREEEKTVKAFGREALRS